MAESVESANRTVPYSDEFWRKFEKNASRHPANLYRYDQIARAVRGWRGPTGHILDLGCGNGALLRHLWRQPGLGRFVGIDASQEIIARNRARGDGIDYFQGDLQNLRRPDLSGWADVVICSEVIEHMPDPDPVFPAAWDLLKPGGMFLLSTQSGKRRRHDIELLGHLRHFELTELVTKVCAAGFTVNRAWACGWPVLNIQKIAASALLGRVTRELASEKEPSIFFRAACKLVGVGLWLSSKSMGPQIFIVAEKRSRPDDSPAWN